jgi:hypothetical protein
VRLADEVAPSESIRQRHLCRVSNPIGMDGRQLKSGCSMIVDPFSDIFRMYGALGGYGRRFAVEGQARAGSRLSMSEGKRPDLYRDIIGKHHAPSLSVAWMK